MYILVRLKSPNPADSQIIITNQPYHQIKLLIVKGYYSMAYPQRSSWPSFHNPDFNQLHSLLEQQTMSLLRERDAITKELQQNNVLDEPYLKPVESHKYIKLNSDRQDNTSNNTAINTKSVLSQKVKQLLDLCKHQNSTFGNELLKVLGQEKQIHADLVSSHNRSSQKTQYFGGNNPIVEAQKESSIVNGQREQFSNPSSGTQSPAKINLPANPGVREVVQDVGQGKLTSEELVQMIEEIQRKALSEIQKLREEKIDLMKQLKHEIQSNNQLQKELNAYAQQQSRAQNLNPPQKQNSNVTPYKQYQFEEQVPAQKTSFQEEILRQIRTEMNHLKQENQNLRLMNQKNQQNHQNPPPNSFTQPNPEQLTTLRQRIHLLQTQLYTRDTMLHSLTQQLTGLTQHGTLSTPHLASLIQQGQAIRQHTLHLIRLKQAQPSSNRPANQLSSFNPQSERIRELQQLLQREQQEKENFLNDLLLFKQKYQQLEQENRSLKRQSKLGSSDLARFSPIYQKSTTGQGIATSVDDYQKLLSQMRNVGRY